MVVIGGDASGVDKKEKENLLLFRYDQQNPDRQWCPVETSLELEGPINIARFAQNAAPHHTLAVGAKQVHILKIESQNQWKVTKITTIDTEPREKCWVSQIIFCIILMIG